LAEKKSQYERIFYTNLKQANNALTLNMHMHGEEPKVQSSAFPITLIKVLRYFVMRVQFINPVFVPGRKEPSLRPDFNFAEYLARASALTLSRFWHLNCLILTLVFACLISSALFV
jgi:hypothetical protein